jgi:hypothetical protein
MILYKTGIDEFTFNQLVSFQVFDGDEGMFRVPQ